MANSVRLPEREAEAVGRYFGAGQPFREIAEEMGISPSSARRMVRKHEKLDRNGFRLGYERFASVLTPRLADPLDGHFREIVLDLEHSMTELEHHPLFAMMMPPTYAARMFLALTDRNRTHEASRLLQIYGCYSRSEYRHELLNLARHLYEGLSV